MDDRASDKVCFKLILTPGIARTFLATGAYAVRFVKKIHAVRLHTISLVAVLYI
jgi:hypothetical protein